MGHDSTEDSWFDGGFDAVGAHGRQRRSVTAVVLGGLLVVTIALGVALGAFGAPGPSEPAPKPAGPTAEQAKAIALAQTRGGTALIDDAALARSLDQLIEARRERAAERAQRPPEPGADGVEPPPAAPEVAATAAPAAAAEAPPAPRQSAPPDEPGAQAGAAPKAAPSAPTTAKAAPVEGANRDEPGAPARAKAEPDKKNEPDKGPAPPAAKAEPPKPAAPPKRPEQADATAAEAKAAAPAATGAPEQKPEPAEAKAAEPAKEPEAKPATADAKATAAKAVDEAAALAGKRDWRGAAEGYTRALAAEPGNTKALVGRGQANFELKKMEAAKSDLEAVLRVSPTHATALLLLGSIAQEQGRKAEARGYYERYLKRYPSGRRAPEIRALLDKL